jgi:integrase
MEGTPRRMASLLCGSGPPLVECVRLRVKDLDFDRRQVTVREGKGEKDRVTMLPQSLVEPLRRQMQDEALATGPSLRVVGVERGARRAG